jgi:hypothetical protein
MEYSTFPAAFEAAPQKDYEFELVVWVARGGGNFRAIGKAVTLVML